MQLIQLFGCNDLSLFVEKLYGKKDSIEERHRHRYEVNTKYVPEMEKNGMNFVGKLTCNF